ncbi:MAG: arsenite methyltransferase [Saprospiraceae bacterium]
MNELNNIKNEVREKYAAIANQTVEQNAQSCCGAGPTGTYTIMSESYKDLPGYNPDADLALGCGLPTQFAQIAEGDTVIDLGSGAGNDCFVARAETGPTGKVLGIDFTPAMVEKARINAEKRGFNNVEFRLGDLEDMPVSDNLADVIVSNCVLNLVPNKKQVFSETFRVLKPGGHFSISDIVLEGDLPEGIKASAEMYAGCVAGAIQKNDYLDFIEKSGFTNIQIQKQKPILIPDEILLEYLSESELKDFLASGTGIFSITVYAEKPGGEHTEKKKLNLKDLKTASTEPCCGPGCC